MRIYSNLEDFDERRPVGTSWRRCVQALRKMVHLAPDITHSLGDSLTYFRTDAPSPRPGEFVGHRRYRLVVCALRDPIELRVARKDALECSVTYSDVTDQEHFCGTADTVRLAHGAIMVMDINEAVQFPQPCSVGIVHLTVEAANFHNK